MNQYALSIGAGPEQCSAIEVAKKLGYKVVAVDGNPNVPGKNIADHFYPIDPKDKKTVIAIAKKYQIQFVVPTPIGRIVNTVGAVNDALNLIGISEYSCNLCSDKHLLHKTIPEFTPSHKIAKGFNEISSSIQIPYILKPQYGSGSRGIRVLITPSPSLIKEHLKELKDNEKTLIEEYIEGKEYGIDGIVIGTTFHLIAIRKKKLSPLPHRQEISYSIPHHIEGLEQTLKLVTKKLKFEDCVVHADIIITPEKQPIIIEISPRPAGYDITTKLLPKALGINLVEETINLLTNKKVNVSPKYSKQTTFSVI
jgi:biotin carboxylase